jgi:hypothetical protein
VLVLNGDSDRMVPTTNTVDLDRRLPNSRLVLYPDAGHGGVFQSHQDFVTRALDAKIRHGDFKLILPHKTPFTLGHDLAGVVTRVGSAVTRFTVGDEVYGRPRDDRIGTFAERIAVHEDDLAIKPAGLTTAEAASVPLVALPRARSSSR